MIFISAQPHDLQFIWQLDVQIHNLKRLGYTEDYHILMYKPPYHKDWNKELDDLEDKWKDSPNIKFFRYSDDEGFFNLANEIMYVSLIRPWMLMKHFELYENLENEYIFYWDSDVLLTKKVPMSFHFGMNKMALVSYTGHREGKNYLDYDYLYSKIFQAIPEKLEQLRQIDPIAKFAECAGITKEIILKNNRGVGGAQYVLKGINYRFWEDVIETCVRLKPFMSRLNQEFFPGSTPQERENNGWQSWCADMWAVLWNLWKRDVRTDSWNKMDFAWSTDPIEKIDEVFIYHDAGALSKRMELNGKKVTMFAKGEFKKKSPLTDIKYLQHVDERYCSSFYAKELILLHESNLRTTQANTSVL